jgi:hypothetical protein
MVDAKTPDVSERLLLENRPEAYEEEELDPPTQVVKGTGDGLLLN